MPDPIPACFRGGGTIPDGGGPSLTTSVYETHLSLAALTWSRTVLGLSLRAALRFYTDDQDDVEEEEEELLSFHVRPWLLWKRQGTRKFHLKDHRRYRFVNFAWDLTRARFSPWGGPEPVSGFFVTVSVDGEMLLVAGDLADEGYNKSRAHRPQNPLLCPALISRREHAVLVDHGGRRSYRTGMRFGGQDHEIAIEMGPKDKSRELAMSMEIDGKQMLLVRRLHWKFRGSEKVEAGSGWIQISWDLHNWFFQPKDEAADAHGKVTSGGGAAELGQALFVLRFVGEGNLGKDKSKEKAHIGNAMSRSLSDGLYNKMNGNVKEDWSDWRGRRRGSLRKKDSSPLPTSSASTSTVMDWTSAEEVELQRAEGFSLVLCACKS